MKSKNKSHFCKKNTKLNKSKSPPKELDNSSSDIITADELIKFMGIPKALGKDILKRIKEMKNNVKTKQ